jgi:hypothetical protein
MPARRHDGPSFYGHSGHVSPIESITARKLGDRPARVQLVQNAIEPSSIVETSTPKTSTRKFVISDIVLTPTPMAIVQKYRHLHFWE